MKNLCLLFLLLLGFTDYVYPEHKPVNLSLFSSKIAIADAGDTVNINIPLVAGNISCVRGFTLAPTTSRVTGDARGINAVGLFSFIKGDFTGVEATGLIGVHAGKFEGVGASGLANIVVNDMSGLQIASVYNFVTGDMRGLQLSPFFNLNGGNGKGMQIGSANIVGKDFDGLQAALTFNYVGRTQDGLQISFVNLCGDLTGAQLGFWNLSNNTSGSQVAPFLNIARSFSGVQISLVNIAEDNAGVQIGMLNLSKESKGVQVGMVNLCKEMKGVPVGVVNLDLKTRFEWNFNFSNISLFSTGIKINTNNYYTIIDLGILKSVGRDQTPGLGFYYGYEFKANKWEVSPDIGFRTHFEDVDTKQLREIDLQIRGTIAYNFTNWFEVHAGLGWNRRFNFLPNRDDKNKLLYFLGFKLFDIGVKK